jgi:DHA1 family bicyclomycin/chloramphenicol resistance-like MFS transporter
MGMTELSPVRFMDRASPPHILTLVCMAGVSALTQTIFLPSLAEMTVYFHTDYATMQLSVALYLGVNAVLQLLVGPLSDRFGRRPVLLWGFAIFVVATLGCLYATSAAVFLTFRMLQASVVVALALSRAVVRDMYDQERSASMIGYVTMGMSVVPMVGPALGGWLDGYFGWQGSFWLLTAAGLATMALIWADLGETAQNRGTRFRQQVREYPELLASPRFWGYALAGAFATGTYMAFLGGAPYLGSQVFDLTTTQLGLALGVPSIGYFVGNWISGLLSTRMGVNRMILWGSMLLVTGMVLTLALFGLGLGSAFGFFALMTFLGVGNGMILPNAAAGMLSVRPRLAGAASGLGGMLQIGGGALLSAWAGHLLQPGSGPMPLLWLMIATSISTLASILIVIARTRQVDLTLSR